jgi:hypothetical protein
LLLLAWLLLKLAALLKQDVLCLSASSSSSRAGHTLPASPLQSLLQLLASRFLVPAASCCPAPLCLLRKAPLLLLLTCGSFSLLSALLPGPCPVQTTCCNLQVRLTT